MKLRVAAPAAGFALFVALVCGGLSSAVAQDLEASTDSFPGRGNAW